MYIDLSVSPYFGVSIPVTTNSLFSLSYSSHESSRKFKTLSVLLKKKAESEYSYHIAKF